MTYVEAQKTLAESDAGKLALKMRPGTRWVLPSGAVIVVYMGWSPDLTDEATAIARNYNRAPPGPDHNTEIAVSHPRAPHTRRIKVADVANWKRADPFIQAPHPMVPRRATTSG